ncbi:MAG: citrate lyase acyl carrier protein [Bacteroidales bacterium]|nr:citrate lyase acyl carrier protein [Bacteroidales bacterium]
MDNKIAEAGNLGPKVRSDCHVKLELTKENGLQIELKSKVESMYGKSIRALIEKELKFFGIENAVVEVTDRGALEHVLMARIETAVKKLIDTDLEFLPEFLPENNYGTSKDQFRFSRLYLPGNAPNMMINAGVHQPNGIILDLEDSVAQDKKTEALHLIRNSLRAVNFYGAERMVRINQGKKGIRELKHIIPHNVNLLLIPKCESGAYIKKLDKKINKIKKEHKISNQTFYMPIIESAMGVEKAFEIATASPNVVSLAVGLEDFTADLGVSRTLEANESFYARTRVINACKSIGIQPIDSVFSDVGDMEGLYNTVKKARSLGFEGMGCIHPRQIQVIENAFAPEESEILKAKKIVAAFEDATAKGLGVVSLGTKMIDPPVVKRAQKTINLAVKLNLLSENWLKEFN